MKALLTAMMLWAGAAIGAPADTVFVNGRIVRFDAPVASALAVEGSTISAVGDEAEIRALIGESTRIVDLGGRTMIPGLIDSHIHAIRAGLNWRTDVDWTGARSVAEALERLRRRARTQPPGTWLAVAGGWTPGQFAEDRFPTPEELEAVAPGHKVFVQWLYNRVFLSRSATMAFLGLVGAPLRREIGADGEPTGWITGDPLSISLLYDRVPPPDLETSIASTRDFFRELNRLGVTGVDDPGGYNLALPDYEALFSLWRQGGLSLRVRYSLCAQMPGGELRNFEQYTPEQPAGDDWLRFNGIGERVTWGMYNNDRPSPQDQEHLVEVLRWAEARGLTATFHWNNDRSVHYLLDAIARVAKDRPIAKLRWSVAHVHDASTATLQRMKSLGLGWLMQDAFYFRGEAYLRQRKVEVRSDVPPIAEAIRMGLPVGAGTDAHRVMDFNPFVALRWMVDGKTIEGLAMRSPARSPSRLEALRLFTEGSAWFSFEETTRGSLEVGKLADLAVLSDDYLGVPVERIAALHSLLTMVGGRVVFADGPYGALESMQTIPSPPPGRASKPQGALCESCS